MYSVVATSVLPDPVCWFGVEALIMPVKTPPDLDTKSRPPPVV